MDKWEAPIINGRLLYYIPDYTLEYFSGELSGFADIWSGLWSGIRHIGGTIWHGITYIPKKLYDFGYKVFHYRSNPSKMVTQGVKDLEQKAGSTAAGVKHKVWYDDLLKTIGQVGGSVAATYLLSKIQNASSSYGIPPDQIYNKSLAWAYKYQDQLRQMGYPSPEAAAASALWHNNGLPPAPNQSPQDIFGRIQHNWVPLFIIAMILIALIYGERR